MLKITLAAILVFMSTLQAPVCAGDKFNITIQVFFERGYDNNVYYQPPGNIIKVKGGGYSKPFKVVLKNITSDTQSLSVDEASQGLGLIAFEITDESGNNNVVTKKIDITKSRSQGYKYIGAGKTKEFEIFLTELDWDNAFKLMRQGSSKLRARASYRDKSGVIYSDYYTIIIE